MKYFRRLILGMSVLSFCFSTRAVAQGATCHSADAVSSSLLGLFKKLMGADSGYRKSLGLYQTPDSAITLVTNPTVCARAGQAVDSVSLADDSTQSLPPYSHPIYVFRIGSSYGVRNSPAPNQHHDFVMFFGTLWQYLSIGAF